MASASGVQSSDAGKCVTTIEPFTGKAYDIEEFHCDTNESLSEMLKELNGVLNSDSTYRSIIRNLQSLQDSGKINIVLDEICRDDINNALESLANKINAFNCFNAGFNNSIYENVIPKYLNPTDGATIRFYINFKCYGEHCIFNVIYAENLCIKYRLFSATITQDIL
jgi:hypothetical protein